MALHLIRSPRRDRAGDAGFEGRDEPHPAQKGRYFFCANCGGSGTEPTHRADCGTGRQIRRSAR